MGCAKVGSMVEKKTPMFFFLCRSRFLPLKLSDGNELHEKVVDCWEDVTSVVDLLLTCW